MNTIAQYSALSTPGLNQVSKMLPDNNGYYKCILGGFNLSNRSGLYYPLTSGIKNMFNTGGIVRRRLDDGTLRGELGHPDISKMAHMDILKRLAIIDPTRVSHHIKSMELVEKKDENGKSIILVYGMLRPSGPYGSSLKESLDNKEENVAFSIRSFSVPSIHHGSPAREVIDILTYDMVMEGGIGMANQFTTATLENLIDNISFTDKDFDTVIKSSYTDGLESNASTLTMIKDNFGWHKIKVNTLSAIDW